VSVPSQYWYLLITVVAVLAACGSDQSAGELPGLAPEHGTPVTAAWADIADGLDAPVTDINATPCHRGEPSCLAAVVAEMEARLAARPCAHTAPFAFTYLEMTRGVAQEIASFDDTAIISIVDARFAQQYFDAFDNWQANRVDDVPAAWQMAFATSDRQQSSAALDLILGMNAHISRDLAYIVAASVASDPNLREQTKDYLRVNDVIASVKSPMLANAADRFDPSLFLLDTELTADGAPDPVTLISDWRAFSFDLGLRLATAETSEDQAAVIAEIERTSTGAAAVLIAAEGAEGTSELAGAIAGRAPGDTTFLDAVERRDFCERSR
jgi:hypothetical protein